MFFLKYNIPELNGVFLARKTFQLSKIPFLVLITLDLCENLVSELVC